MDEINKYFKSARRELIDKNLQDLDFKPYGTSYLARLTSGNILQLINFHKYRFGGQFKIEIAIRPMFCPHDNYLTLLPGNSLYGIATNNKSDKWWKSTTKEEIEESLKDIHNLIHQFALPFFEATTTGSDILRSYKKNIFGISKFGNKICWGTEGWENFDFAHIYLHEGDRSNALKQIQKAYNEFQSDDREWAQVAASKCLEILKFINSGHSEINRYLEQTTRISKKNLKLENW